MSKEDLLQMEMKQEVTFRDALNRLESKEAESKYTPLHKCTYTQN